MRRRFMLASALVSMTIAAPLAHADREITDEQDGPFTTSTAGDDGGADNIVITTTGRVTIQAGETAITVDSDNDVINNGIIGAEGDTDGGVGIHVIGGNSGTITNTGTIRLISETVGEDEDDDGRIDGDLTTGTNRVAILVDGSEVFTGNIIHTSAGAITVIGNDSSGIRVLTGIDGNLEASGRFTMTGDNNRAVDVRADISGDVTLGGPMSIGGANSSGVVLSGDVGGAVRFLDSAITTSGYRFAGRPADQIREEFEDEDMQMGGAAVILNGSIAEGVYVSGPNDDDQTEATTTMNVRGSAPVMHILANADSEDLVIGEVVLEAIEDDPDTEEDESREEQFLGYSFVNRGQLTASGELDAVDATALRIEGQDGFTATLEDGFLNDGVIRSAAYSGDVRPGRATSTAAYIGNGAVIPVFTNTNTLLAAASGTRAEAEAIHIAEGAILNSIVNEGSMRGSALLGGSTTVIRDLSGSLTEVTNSGQILATYTPPVDADDATPYRTVAIDTSLAGSVGTTVRQYRPEDAEDDWIVAIRGDIRLGAGDDALIVEAGEVDGDIAFGGGADRLEISGGALVEGNLSDNDGRLTINVGDGELRLGAATDVTITEATFGDGSVLRFQIDDETGEAAVLNATGTVTFEQGSRVQATLTNLIDEGASLVVLSADNLVIAETLDALQDTTAPYLYESNLEFDPNDENSLILTLRRRNAGELGMNASQAAAYEAAYAGWQDNTELGAAIAGLMTEEEFFGAYDQLLPEYAASAIQFAQASNDSAIGAIANRLEAVRRSPDETGGLWIQEFAYYADRAGTAFGPGYRGHGIGLAAGFDRPLGPLYSVGVNFVGAASEIEEADGFDEPMSAITAQIGGYAGAELPGGLLFDVYGGAGFDSFEHNRTVLIGDFEANPSAEWTGYHITGAARVARNFEFGRYFVRPAATVDYLALFEESYVETGGGDGIDLAVDERDSSSLSGTALLTFGAVFENSNSWWSPHARVGYRNEFTDADTETTANFVDYDETFTLRSQQLPGSGFIFGFGLTAGSGYSTFSLDYDADLRDDFIRHTARLVMRMVF